jgi:hypothetical protein
MLSAQARVARAWLVCDEQHLKMLQELPSAGQVHVFPDFQQSTRIEFDEEMASCYYKIFKVSSVGTVPWDAQSRSDWFLKCQSQRCRAVI